jgi:hypothetical protein
VRHSRSAIEAHAAVGDARRAALCGGLLAAALAATGEPAAAAAALETARAAAIDVPALALYAAAAALPADVQGARDALAEATATDPEHEEAALLLRALLAR